MPTPEPYSDLPPEFDGRVRLFPLPELVVFPNAMQPLHIFEPRYCELLHEALATDQLIALATLAPGWQQPTFGQPAISPQICICRIISHSTTDEDRHNILLVGLRRARMIEEEQDTGRPFRSARVELIDDIYPPSGTSDRASLKKELLHAFRQLIPDVAEVQKNLHDLMASHMQLGAVTDIIGFTMQFEESLKLDLLGEGNVDRRAQLLLETLIRRAKLEAGSGPLDAPLPQLPFPPPFSDN